MAGAFAAVLAKQGDIAGQYLQALPNLLQMKLKPAKNVYSRRSTAIDEIVLHGTESRRSQEDSANYSASANDAGTSVHYWIGRDYGIVYAMVPEDKAAGHAGNPDGVDGVEDHNCRSIGIEMYQQDISMFKGDASKLDFTDWQYDTVAMLTYDLCHRLGIRRSMIVGHKKLNPVQRGDPRNFDWARFYRKFDDTATMMATRFGADYKIAQ